MHGSLQETGEAKTLKLPDICEDASGALQGDGAQQTRSGSGDLDCKFEPISADQGPAKALLEEVHPCMPLH